MKQITNFIVEKLIINKNIKVNNESDIPAVNMINDLIKEYTNSKWDTKDFIQMLENLIHDIEIEVNDLNEKYKCEEFNDSDIKWVCISTEGFSVDGVTKQDFSDWEDNELETECRKLKLGDYYDSDGGLHIYIRIKDE